MDKCYCTKPGWCANHQRYKSPRELELCQTRADYRALWAKLTKHLSFQDKVVNLVNAICNALKVNFQQASPDMQNYRFGVCAECPKNVDGKCQKCGCIIELKVKFASEECPEGKWKRVELPVVVSRKCGCGV